ncbi:hypothetical protein GINT2_001458 [Glugoides intestinalis]
MVRNRLNQGSSGWLREMAEKYNISYEEAYKMYSKLNFNDKKLLEHLKNTTVRQKDELSPKITIFLNGIFVKDKFYDFSDKSNVLLAEMLDKNEFDREIFESKFGNAGQFAEIVIDRRNENYENTMDMSEIKRNLEKTVFSSPTKRRKTNDSDSKVDTDVFKYVIGKGKVLISEKHVPVVSDISEASKLPAYFTVGNNPTVTFKLLYKSREYTIVSDPGILIKQISEIFNINLGVRVYFSISGKILDENESVLALKGSMCDVFDH